MRQHNRNLQSSQEKFLPTPLKSAWIQFIASYEWNWFCHLTFRSPVSIKGAKRRFGQWFNDIQRGDSQDLPLWEGIRAVIGLERGWQNGCLHIHGLVGGVGGRDITPYWEKWFKDNGRAKISRLRGQQGIAYVAKYAIKDDLLEIFP